MFALGLASAALLGPGVVVGLVASTCALLSLVVAAIRGRESVRSVLLVPAILLMGLFGGVLLGATRVADIEGGALPRHMGGVSSLEVVVTGEVRSSHGWQSAAVTVRRCDLDQTALGEKAWLEVPPDDDVVSLRQGMVVSCTAQIEAPEGGGASGFDQRRWLLQQGVCVVLKVRDAGSLAIVGQRAGVAGAFDRLREAARDHLARGPDSRVNEVLRGVVTGDTSGIDESWLEAFRRAGTAHMLAVSGLHVASLAAIMIGVARLLRTPRWVGFALAAGSALLMIPFVGPSPPIIRAAVMIVIVLLGRWVGRGRDQWQVLALAAVVILSLNPFALFDVGFQLSFSALSGIMILGPLLRRLLKRLPDLLAGTVAVSLAAGLGTAPVALVQFGRASLVSPLANLLVVPVLPIVVGLGMASVFAGFIWEGLSAGLDTLASLPTTWTVQVSRLGALAPVLASGDVGRAVGVLVGGAVLLPVALAFTGRRVRAPFDLPLPFFRRSLLWARRHRPKRPRMALAGAAALVFCGLLLGSVGYSLGAHGLGSLRAAIGGRSWPGSVEVRVLDVGQGNAVLVRTPNRRALLFDGGPEGCDLARTLRSLGVRRLDAVVVSHPHADHFAGLLEALPEMEVGALVDNVRVTPAGARGPPSESGSSGAGGEAAQYLAFRDVLAERGCGYLQASTGDSLEMDGVAVRFFCPSSPVTMTTGADPWGERGGPPTGDELNDASLVALLSVGEMDVLLPGDAEAAALGAYELPAAELLIVPHHGSRGAVSTSFLKRLDTRVGIVSVGEGNSFGHPDPSTVTLLSESGSRVLRTDTVGWVSCKLTEDQMHITTERTPSR